MKVIEIVRAHLVAGGYDGLVCSDAECGCELADLQPCGESMSECEPAYRGADRGSPVDWAMYASKEAALRDQSVARGDGVIAWGDIAKARQDRVTPNF